MLKVCGLQVFKGRARWLHYFHCVYKSAAGAALARSSDDAVDARRRRATRFHRADGNRFVTLSRCNYTSGECARMCARVHVRRTGPSQHAAYEWTNARTHTHARRRQSIRQYASLIIPVIIINCSDPRHADEIGIDLRNAQWSMRTPRDLGSLRTSFPERTQT